MKQDFARHFAIGAAIAAGVIGLGALIAVIVLSARPAPISTPVEEPSRPTANKPATKPVTPVNQVSSPIYVTFLTHIEEPGRGKPDYLADEDLFWQQRAAYVKLANFLHDRDLPFNFQSDWNFLEALVKWDKGDASTNGKNLVKWMHDNLGFSIDPHAHETKYTYADVAYLINALGVTPSNLAGGFLAYPVEDSKIEYLREPIHGNVYDYTWQADVIWGGGTFLHREDALVDATGIWRPKSSAEYFVNDPNGSLPSIGSINGWTNLQDLLKLQAAGKLNAGIYTLHIMCSPEDILDDKFFVGLTTRIDQYSDEAKAGRIVWADLQATIEAWETVFDSEPNVLSASEMLKMLPVKR